MMMMMMSSDSGQGREDCSRRTDQQRQKPKTSDGPSQKILACG